MSDDDADVGNMSIPDAIIRICKEGKGLWWDGDSNCYEVADPEQFVACFKALRRSRRDGRKDRPFAAMHRHFKMISGRGWTFPGTRFIPILPSKVHDEANACKEAVHLNKRARTAAHKPSNSWFHYDIKYCSQCGRGTITVEQKG